MGCVNDKVLSCGAKSKIHERALYPLEYNALHSDILGNVLISRHVSFRMPGSWSEFAYLVLMDDEFAPP